MTIRALVFPILLLTCSHAKEFYSPTQPEKKSVPNAKHKQRICFNAPTTTEVPVVIVGQDFEKRDIVLHSRDNRLLRISEMHHAYDALQYPLMSCRGEDGYYINIPQCEPNTKVPLKKTMSAAAFYSYRIMECDCEECYLLLFQFRSEARVSNRLVNYNND